MLVFSRRPRRAATFAPSSKGKRAHLSCYVPRLFIPARGRHFAVEFSNYTRITADTEFTVELIINVGLYVANADVTVAQ